VIAEAIVLAAVLIAGVTDSLEHKIHNVLTFPLMLVGIAYHAVFAPMGWWQGLAGFVALGLPFFVMHAISPALLAAGDVKLYMALGALLGVRWGLTAGVLSLIVAAPMTLGYLVLSGRLRDLLRVAKPGASPPQSKKMPFGACIAVGAVLAVALRDAQPLAG